MYIYSFMYLFILMYMYIYIYTCVYMYIDIFIYLYLYIYIYVYIYIYTYYIYVRIYTISVLRNGFAPNPKLTARLILTPGRRRGSTPRVRKEAAPGWNRLPVYYWVRHRSPRRWRAPAWPWLAFTRYSSTPKLSCTIQSSFYGPLHMHCTHYCNTIAWLLLRTVRPPPDPLCVCHTPYNIGRCNIV